MHESAYSCVVVFMLTRVCLFAHTSVFMRAQACLCMRKCVYAMASLFMRMWVYACASVSWACEGLFACMRVSLRAWGCLCMHIFICVHTYAYKIVFDTYLFSILVILPALCIRGGRLGLHPRISQHPLRIFTDICSQVHLLSFMMIADI